MNSELLLLAELLRKHRECGPLASLNIVKGDIAVVAGAYEGATMKFLLDLYPDIHVFGYEPQQVHRERAEKLLEDGSQHRWMIFSYGIGVKDGFFPMGEVGTDAASFVPDPVARTQEEGELRDAAHLFNAPIKLLVLNIEGYEYELIPYLESKGILRDIENIVIQFHDVGVTQYQREYLHTTILMERTHRCRWVHPQEPSWTWQWWERQV